MKNMKRWRRSNLHRLLGGRLRSNPVSYGDISVIERDKRRRTEIHEVAVLFLKRDNNGYG